jgi:hypothetical protein
MADKKIQLSNDLRQDAIRRIEAVRESLNHKIQDGFYSRWDIVSKTVIEKKIIELFIEAEKIVDTVSGLPGLPICHIGTVEEYKRKKLLTWCDEALETLTLNNNKTAKKNLTDTKQSENDIADKPDAQELTCTLMQFMEKNCDIPVMPDNLKSNYFASKRTLLNDGNGKKLTLPKTVIQPKSGRANIYKEKDLRKQWSEYRKACPILPPLRTIS